MADEISDLRLLARLVEAGSLTSAAIRINSSLPAVSRRLAAMENRLGVRLIERRARRFQLTDEGFALHARALSILSDIDDAEAEISLQQGSPRGKLVICAPVHIGRAQIAGLIAEFARTHPAISVELMLSDAEVDVAEDGIDVILNIGPPKAQSVIARRLLPSRRVVCAAPGYLARMGIPKVPDDLLKHECLLIVRGLRTIDRWRFKENGEEREVQVHGRLSTMSSEVAYQWILHGEGVGIKALWDIHHDLASGRLVECLSDYACDVADLYLVYAARKHLPLRMRSFIDFIVEKLANYYPAV